MTELHWKSTQFADEYSGSNLPSMLADTDIVSPHINSLFGSMDFIIVMSDRMSGDAEPSEKSVYNPSVSGCSNVNRHSYPRHLRKRYPIAIILSYHVYWPLPQYLRQI
jgi:hypothetical protein